MQETGDVLELRVSGKVRLGNLVAYDAETGTEWLQETGKALEGPLEGKTLAPLDAENWNERVRWDEWQGQHPETQVLVCGHCEG